MENCRKICVLTTFPGRYAIPITSNSISFVSIRDTFFSTCLEQLYHIIYWSYTVLWQKNRLCCY